MITVLDKVTDLIEKYHMLSVGDRIVAGVSGGADSVCMLLLLLKLRESYGLYIHAVHVNHGIRGETAERDESFVTGLCGRLGVELTCIHADIPRIMSESGESSEEAGRNVRYRAFRECCSERGCNRIAVAHNLDDNAETVMFNMLRGSGLHGLCGILPSRDLGGGVTLIRPLLAVRKHEIVACLNGCGESFCEDETNSTEDYRRNMLRNVVFPYLCENINAGAAVHLASLSEQACELEAYIRKQTDAAVCILEERGQLYYKTDCGGDARHIEASGLSAAVIDIEGFKSFDDVIGRELIRLLIGKLAGRLKDIGGVHIRQCAELMYKQSGRQVMLPYNITARRVYGKLILERSGHESAGAEEETAVNAAQLPYSKELSQFGAVLHLRLFEYKKSDIIPKKRYTKWFDYDKIRNTIEVRTRRQGDFFQIVRGRPGDSIVLGEKTLKSYFTDCKLEKDKRDSWPLLAAGSHILWVIGERSTDGFRVGPDTRRVLEASLVANSKENNERCFEDDEH